jgi:hypothetical protein
MLIGLAAGLSLTDDRSASRREPSVVYVEEYPGKLPDALRASREEKTGFFERKRGEVQIVIGK